MTMITTSLPKELMDKTQESDDSCVVESSNDPYHKPHSHKEQKNIKGWFVAFAIMAGLMVVNVSFTAHVYQEMGSMKALSEVVQSMKNSMTLMSENVSVLQREVIGLKALDEKINGAQSLSSAEIENLKESVKTQYTRVSQAIDTIHMTVSSFQERINVIEKTNIEAKKNSQIKKTVIHKTPVPKITSLRSLNGINIVTLQLDAEDDSGFIREGESWNGWTVTTIDGNKVTVKKNGISKELQF